MTCKCNKRCTAKRFHRKASCCPFGKCFLGMGRKHCKPLQRNAAVRSRPRPWACAICRSLVFYLLSDLGGSARLWPAPGAQTAAIISPISSCSAYSDLTSTDQFPAHLLDKSAPQKFLQELNIS